MEVETESNTAKSPATAEPRKNKLRARGAHTRRALLVAALYEFAASGFDAASTRAIATRAGVRQGQLTYHFPSKLALWQAAVDDLFTRFDVEFGQAMRSIDDGDAATRFAGMVRALVRAVAAHPELNRIMVHETTSRSDRLEWLVEHHVQDRFDAFGELWQELRSSGATTIVAEPVIVYYTVVGAASLLYVNAAEAHLLTRDQDDEHHPISDALTDAHAEMLVAMLLAPHPNPPTERT